MPESSFVLYFYPHKHFDAVVGPTNYETAAQWLKTKGFDQIDNFVWKKAEVLFSINGGKREISRSPKIQELWVCIIPIHALAEIDCRDGEF